ncbi:MAG: ftsH 4 [Sporomusa sp.]|nr:ftsH 4 [Sporomusa sp.]
MDNFAEQFDTYIRSRVTLIVIVTPEEQRAIEHVKSVCEQKNRTCLSWDVADGFVVLTGRTSLDLKCRDPLVALDLMEKTGMDNAGDIFVCKDFHDFWSNPPVRRKLRSVVQRLTQTRTSIVITTPTGQIPDELQDEAVVIHLRRPNGEELDGVLDSLLKGANVKMNLTDIGREKVVQAAMGMTAGQARRVFSKAIVTCGCLDDRSISLITEEKAQLVRQSEALEFLSTTETTESVGGLGVLKDWLRLREKAFTKDARDYGLPAPKGIAMVGIPGTGKSLTAKMISGLWQLPLLRLDVGALFGSYVGESEDRTRRALHIAETIAPCILWVDEIEKAFAFGSGDAGTSQRVFATLLTWMQDKKAPCFVVATANNIAALPPELMRKGRFDEIFFLDLPHMAERREIFVTHLKRRNRSPREFDIKRLVKESDGYVGAEIEQAIIDAMYLAFSDNMREITTEDIVLSLKRQVPLSVSQRENIQYLRQWLQEGRAQSASYPGEFAGETGSGQVFLEIEDQD